MECDPVFLSRLQFAFVISFHIIFPAFTIGLAAWLATIEGARLLSGRNVYRRLFDFWLKVFALSFGMGVVNGIGHGVPVWHELECDGGAHRCDPRPVARL
jgi:cytochrome bd ubiquinol oxidase subunit I